MILSVSRRTDIPAFYPQWFMNRVNEKFVYVRNAFNANQISNISLDPEIVDCIVFWSKNPAPLLPCLETIDKIYNGAFYFQYSINDYGKEIEPNVPDIKVRIKTFKKIADKYGKLKVVWRYDPIFLNPKYTLDWHIESFQKLLFELKGYTDTCVISFVDMYSKTKNNTKAYDIKSLDIKEMNFIASEFSKIAKGSNIVIKTCAEGIDLAQYGIQHNSCIDRERIEQIIRCKLEVKKDNQRPFCQCIECADIGQYNTCQHGCKYCYANFNPNMVAAAVEAHDDNSPLLTGIISENCKITKYAKAKSLKIKESVMQNGQQMELF